MPSVQEIYYQQLFDSYLFTSGKIKVKPTFHGQMGQIKSVLGNDRTGMVSTILEYMIHAGTVDINFNASNLKLTKIFNTWKENVNAHVNIDIPRGLRGFTEQYFRERWKSSFIVVSLRWKQIDGYWIPTRMYLYDGSSIYVKNESKTLNGNTYFVGDPKKDGSKQLKNTKTSSILIRKPYNQWYDLYPTPYLVRKGTLYHSLFKGKILDRQSEIVETAFPYQLLIKVGTQEAIKKGMGPSQDELDAIKEEFQNKKQKFDEQAFSKGLVGAFSGDVNLEELIPNYQKAMDEAITKSEDRNILNSLGMIELKGVSATREEAILNPKILVEEVKDGVKDYVELLTEIVAQIKLRNAGKYTVNDRVEVQPDVIKTFLTDDMRTLIRSWYDRGIVGQKSGLENTTDLDFETQVREREVEDKLGLDTKLYPRVTQNNEKDPADLTPDSENVPEDKKSGSPESKNFTNAGEETECIMEPMKSICGIPNKLREEFTKDEQRLFRGFFNECFEKCTELEYDNFLRQKASMEYACEQTKKSIKKKSEVKNERKILY